MSSAVAELDGYLQSMLALKPPGVSGSKINSITSLCTANVQSESVLIQKIYTHFKRAPGTHKLGVLYVVDSVTRQWVDSARRAGQSADSNAPDGTFAAGVKRVTDLLPVLMADIINNAPEDQKDKIRKLVDIWERGATFPAAMLSSFKEKLNAPVSQNVESTTPEGSPAPGFNPLLGLTQQQPQQGALAGGSAPAQSVPDTSSILKALADMAKQSTAAAPAVATAAQTSPNNVLNTQSAAPAPVSSSVEQTAQQSNGQGVNPYAGNLAAQFAGLSNLAPNMFPTQPQAQPTNPPPAPQNPLAALLQQQQQPAPPPPQQQQQPQQPISTLTPESLQQQLGLIQLLAAQGIPQEQWATALQILSLSNPAATTGMAPPNPAVLSGFGQPAAQNAWGAPAHDTSSSRDRDRERDRDRDRDHDYVRSPPSQYRRRSRSPGWDRRRDVSPPRRRDSPVYGEYHGDSPGRNRADPRDMRGRRGNDYRQRSPPGRRRRSPTPPRKDNSLPPPGPKFVEWDYSIGQGNIKVLSRTLFVGGVTSSESHLRTLFSRYGAVQTCIVNIDKRHAFVKMISRRDAVNAREGMEQYKSGDMQLRTRWGVGFGPRDCSDYQTGISVIPIERLTEADRKWMLTAEYGGTGGKPIESGMVVEEPDIEIGAGVSSKAISRRMATDQGGKRGPQSSRPTHDQNRFRRPERGMDDGPANDRDRDRDNSNANNVAVPPAVPGFGFQFPGMPMFPPGFMLGGAQPSSTTTTPQPPPPGSSS
ncbi:hypothetical protein D8B26_006445 [Coccidioides posadasii str. Silveira]|uniref:Uncharacterized protein n=3 Tax=Coccidioides posadasii TaxID=199306 RepID=E9CT70_COCPS|nr:RNA recognition motif containing protein [Coccidioides posadasii C735 delta SOWgp]EER27483.1 RNA recognition motif containing protein [Coccidioides posadasii C735 delta SOWgp]EFW22880.1 conserved hypothetical protein [Coccidioides posadasii str. Silveira]KMM67322.1 hypothetical protein CPAG_03657 [Coccidioides posadasii RMSCC 3488]QVM11801.1 hypothetical protein D8B26_006445 [Coccidioides posadasii str. Silveira]|eukprot:XP_003069628.1 RNA recognition motif containing protein [Coccidioides posadasii C735 delta SOWgp]